MRDFLDELSARALNWFTVVYTKFSTILNLVLNLVYYVGTGYFQEHGCIRMHVASSGTNVLNFSTGYP